jgi:hypothetical protein
MRSRSCSTRTRRSQTRRRGLTNSVTDTEKPRHGTKVDVPLDEPKYDAKWSADDPKKGCVVDKIKEFKATLKDKSKSVEERRRAVRFLIQGIEDMHQPCHVGDNKDRGGNGMQVRFFGRGTNMHCLWDSALLAQMSKEEDYWLKELTVLPSSQMPQDAAAGTVEELGHGIAARGQGSVRGPCNGPADQVRGQVGARLPQQEHSGGQGADVSGRYQAGESVERVL